MTGEGGSSAVFVGSGDMRKEISTIIKTITSSLLQVSRKRIVPPTNIREQQWFLNREIWVLQPGAPDKGVEWGSCVGVPTSQFEALPPAVHGCLESSEEVTQYLGLFPHQKALWYPDPRQVCHLKPQEPQNPELGVRAFFRGVSFGGT